MLTGKALGEAIEAARIKKKVTKKALAEEFGVTSPSIQDWVNRGTIDKAKLPKLWAYFADVVGPEHWGMTSSEQPDAPDLAAALNDWRLQASARSQAVIDQLTMLAQKNALRDEDWELIEQMAARFLKR